MEAFGASVVPLGGFAERVAGVGRGSRGEPPPCASCKTEALSLAALLLGDISTPVTFLSFAVVGDAKETGCLKRGRRTGGDSTGAAEGNTALGALASIRRHLSSCACRNATSWLRREHASTWALLAFSVSSCRKRGAMNPCHTQLTSLCTH
jgi:hypothetical protein